MSGDVVVLGAGLAGLSAAAHIGDECEVFEQHDKVGGHCRTHWVDGFAFDEGGHVFFGKGDCAEEFVWQPMGDQLAPHQAEIWNNYGGRSYGRYPVQVNAHALPPELATDCVLDFIRVSNEPEREVSNYEDWCRASFGDVFAENFMLRYARKVWTVEPSEMTTEWLGTSVGARLSRPDLQTVIRGAIDPEPQELNYLTKFSYPTAGGFDRIAGPVAGQVSNLNLGVGVSSFDTTERRITLSDGTSRSYEIAISTIPLPELVRMTVDAPDAVREAAERLMWTSLRCVNFGIDRSDVGPGHWCYFYDHEIPFFRVDFPHRFSPNNAPDGHGAISCEIAYSRRKPLDDANLVERVRQALVDVGVVEESDRIVATSQVDAPYAYVVYDFERAAALGTIHEWMRSVGLIPCGRFAEWEYHWSFEALESGRRAAAEITSRV
jgi:protoporphyrinogen oxidase